MGGAFDIRFSSATAVWLRHLAVYARIWKWSAIPAITESTVILLALGMGLGSRIQGFGDGYIEFLAPGLIMGSAMWAAGYDSSYGMFFRMERQRTYDAMLATQVQVADVVAGEVLYGATRAAITSFLVGGIYCAFGILPVLSLVPIVFVGAAIGAAIATLGVAVCTRFPVMDMLSLFISFVLMPMFWLSGVFYDVNDFSSHAQIAQWLSPLYHGVAMSRHFATANLGLVDLGHLGVVVLIVVALWVPAVRGLGGRILN